MCTYSYVGKIPICHSFWVVSAFLISVIDHEIPLIISCHQRGSTIGVVSKSDQRNNGFIVCSVIEENNISRNKKS